MAVYTATSEDIKPIARLGEAYVDSTPFAGDYDYDMWFEFVRKCAIKANIEVAAAIVENRVVGFGIGVVARYPWTQKYRIVMEHIYVEPGYESSRPLLFEHMERWGQKLNLSDVMVLNNATGWLFKGDIE
jgi:hypothetical protein